VFVRYPVLLQGLKNTCHSQIHDVYHRSCVHVPPVDNRSVPYLMVGRDNKRGEHIGDDVLCGVQGRLDVGKHLCVDLGTGGCCLRNLAGLFLQFFNHAVVDAA